MDDDACPYCDGSGGNCVDGFCDYCDGMGYHVLAEDEIEEYERREEE